MIDDDHLPRLVETDWRDELPLKQGIGGDGANRPGYKTFGKPPVAVIWYRQEDDTVVLHFNDGLRGAQRARVYDAARALRLQVAYS